MAGQITNLLCLTVAFLQHSLPSLEKKKNEQDIVANVPQTTHLPNATEHEQT